MSNKELPTIEAQVRRGLSDKTLGWWVSDVLTAFGYLETEFGYQLAEVFLHFRGSYLRYAGPAFDLVVACDPEDTGHIVAELWVYDDRKRQVAHRRALAVNDVLRARGTDLSLPDPTRGDLSEAAVREAVATWAVGLRDRAPDVLRGAWPDGLEVNHLW